MLIGTAMPECSPNSSTWDLKLYFKGEGVPARREKQYYVFVCLSYLEVINHLVLVLLSTYVSFYIAFCNKDTFSVDGFSLWYQV